MNREDIIRMAREAGLVPGPSPTSMLERFAAIVAAAEREACAKVCDEQVERSLAAIEKAKRITDYRIYRAAAQTATWNATAIRARGNT